MYLLLVYECTCRSVFLGGEGGGERIYSQQNNAVITTIAREIVFLSTVLLIDDYQGVGWLVLLLYVPSQQLWSLRDG